MDGSSCWDPDFRLSHYLWITKIQQPGVISPVSLLIQFAESEHQITLWASRHILNVLCTSLVWAFRKKKKKKKRELQHLQHFLWKCGDEQAFYYSLGPAFWFLILFRLTNNFFWLELSQLRWWFPVFSFIWFKDWFYFHRCGHAALCWNGKGGYCLKKKY